MSKPDGKVEIKQVERAFKALGDILRRAAQNADALDLKPDAKDWLLDQFAQEKPKSNLPVTDKTIEYAREIVRQQQELEQQVKATPGNTPHAETEKQRRKSKQNSDDLPPH